jgi:hypothetical protein
MAQIKVFLFVDTIYLLIFVTEKQGVFCEIGIQFLNIWNVELLLKRNNIHALHLSLVKRKYVGKNVYWFAISVAVRLLRLSNFPPFFRCNIFGKKITSSIHAVNNTPAEKKIVLLTS